MPDWKILITDGLHPKGIAILNDFAQVDDRPGLRGSDLLGLVADYHALIVRGQTRVTAPLLEAAANLKVVGRAGVGVDNIDLAAAQSRGVTVVNAPTATTIAVAEHTLGLMLALIRHIPQANSSMKSGLWQKKQFLGSELHGKTLGIIGMGHIGSAVAQRAAAFGMEILGHDPLLSDAEIEARGAAPVPLQELYTRADFISLHVPLTPQTRGMINGQSLGHMKRGVYLICTARGGQIDEIALLNALETGQVAGAALDVFANEPPGLSALVAHPNVVATPHLGAQTAESQARAAVDIAEEVIAALRGAPLRWKIV
jgi:D-3-phosphoglycerate dehydrogenase